MQRNRIELAGYISAKPEVRYLPSGTPVANARLGQTYEYTQNNEPVKTHQLVQSRFLWRSRRHGSIV